MAMGPRKGDKPNVKPTVEPRVPVKAIESFGNALSNAERRMARSDWENFTNRLWEGGGEGNTTLKQYKNLRDSIAQGALIAGKAKTRNEALAYAEKDMKPLMDRRAKEAAKKTAKAERGRTSLRGKAKDKK